MVPKWRLDLRRFLEPEASMAGNWESEGNERRRCCWRLKCISQRSYLQSAFKATTLLRPAELITSTSCVKLQPNVQCWCVSAEKVPLLFSYCAIDRLEVGTGLSHWCSHFHEASALGTRATKINQSSFLSSFHWPSPSFSGNKARVKERKKTGMFLHATLELNFSVATSNPRWRDWCWLAWQQRWWSWADSCKHSLCVYCASGQSTSKGSMLVKRNR